MVTAELVGEYGRKLSCRTGAVGFFGEPGVGVEERARAGDGEGDGGRGTAAAAGDAPTTGSCLSLSTGATISGDCGTSARAIRPFISSSVFPYRPCQNRMSLVSKRRTPMSAPGCRLAGSSREASYNEFLFCSVSAGEFMKSHRLIVASIGVGLPTSTFCLRSRSLSYRKVPN